MFRLVFIVALVGLAFVETIESRMTGRRISQLDGRIVGGKDAKIEDHPYQLSLEFQKRHRCGASLIRPNVAVTAAHCTEDVGGLEAHLSVRAGSSLLHKSGQVARILKICDHPKYDTNMLDYDVSVLLLNQSLTLGTEVKTIPLQPVKVEVPTGTEGTVTGWGSLINGGTLSQRLQVVQVPKIEDSVCIDLYRIKNITVTNRMTCFGFTKGGKDTCQGDSGGPLVLNGKLIGIVSWGFACAAPEQPGVYTKVSHPEINSHINKCLARFV